MMAFFSYPARGAGALGLALCLALPVAAQVQTNPLGVVDAMIGGVAYHGETLDVPSEGTATAEFRAFGPVHSITIQAHDPEAESITRNVLVVDISLMGNDASAPAVDVSVSYWPEGMRSAFYVSDEGGEGAEVVFDVLSLGDDAAASGSFTALLCRKESMFAEADLDTCLPVEGTFDTALRPGE